MEAYLDFLTELGALFTQLTDLEREKMTAVQAGDLDQLNSCIRREQALSLSLRGCIRREQALSLSLRGMDRKRETMLEELGMTGVNLRQLPDRCPPQLQARAQAVTEDLRRRYEVLNSSRESARTMLECNLHKLERQLEELGAPQDLEPGYQPAQADLPPGMRTDFHA